MTWASSQSATGPCGASNTAGTLSGGAYTQSFAYDVLDRETSGPGGSYTYGNSAHLHAVTAIGSAYTASYDASGDLVCRAPTSGTTCASTPTTGAQLTYDAAGRMASWQNTPTSPTDGALDGLSRGYCRGGSRVRQYAWTLACAPGATAIRRSVSPPWERKGEIILDTEPLLITLARALDREHVDYRVLGQPSPGAGKPAKERAPQTELATIELNRRICFPDGRVLAIAHHGGLLSGDRELRRALIALGAPPPPLPTTRRSSGPPRGQPASHEPPLAILHRERTGLLGHRHVLIVAGANGEGERRFALRRRHWFGSPANVDVVPLLGHATPAEPVLLQAEKSGTWRQRLRAKWLAPKELSLPVVLFVLNALADLDRRAAVAASAGAAGV